MNQGRTTAPYLKEQLSDRARPACQGHSSFSRLHTTSHVSVEFRPTDIIWIQLPPSFHKFSSNNIVQFRVVEIDLWIHY